MSNDSHTRRATGKDVRQMFRQAEDHTVAEILALHPTLVQLEEAVTKMEIGAEETFADRGSEDLVVARIIEIAASEGDDYEERRSEQ